MMSSERDSLCLLMYSTLPEMVMTGRAGLQFSLSLPLIYIIYIVFLGVLRGSLIPKYLVYYCQKWNSPNNYLVLTIFYCPVKQIH